MSEFREATFKDKAFGIYVLIPELIVAIITFQFSKVRFYWMLIKLTARGGFEVEVKERDVQYD